MNELFLQVTVSGLLIGGVYALLSIGLTMIFGVVRIINFAHGELMMLAMYLTFWLHSSHGVDPYLSLLVVAPAMFVLGVAIQRLVVQPLLEAPALMKVFATVGLYIALQNLALMLFTADFRTIQTPYASASFRVGAISVSEPRLYAFLCAILMILVLWAFLKFTLVGKALRAVAENRTVSALMGIRVTRLYLLAFGMGSAITGVAGTLLLPFSYVFPTIGSIYTMVAFVVVVLGGMGNMLGAFFGGLFIGLVESFSGTYVSPAIKEAAYFVIFILVLLVRPQGLFGMGKGNEEVGLK
ncbi:MAG: branched-chain amino acid ABC transporter permease [Candidatus Methylomirabilota bacterium]